MRGIGIFVVLIAVAACTKPAEQAPGHPGAVEVARVRATGIVSQGQIETCSREVRASGAQVLYQGEMGLMLVDRRASELSLRECRVSFEDNHELALSPATRPNQPDLPTLLRLLPAEEIGARSFVAANPTFDGRGVVIGILDTGVEIDHPMLRNTSTGALKVIDFQDTSGEGRVALSPVTPDAEGKFKLADGPTYTVGAAVAEPQFGIFLGTTMKYSEDIADKDTFHDIGVLSFKDASGARKVRVDANDNKTFADDAELSDYAVQPTFIKLGEKQTLTTSIKVTDDGKVVNLCFDDGTHGTHVAGIAAGYDPAGLQGVAPGAQVVAVKIGDNRLSGGSTTTASMMLAIDYAVKKGVRILNLSYGIRSGSNLGKSAIDQYVDQVARQKDIIFSISAGNEGPGLLTTGTPAGAKLAITNGAYVSKETARELYGYAAVEDNNIWFFSSVGPQLDGGLKPTLLAPGSALASVPPWVGGHAAYRGTSMASPQATGGLALILSAAQQSELPVDRVRVTRAVYGSAVKLPGLALVEQGHGLLSVPKAVDELRSLKSEAPVEYATNGIYVRSRVLSQNLFAVTVTPFFGPGATPEDRIRLRTFRLTASDPWITLPASTTWMAAAPKAIQVGVEPSVLATPGLKSGKITAVDEATGKVAFVVPVTVVSPSKLDDASGHKLEVSETIRVGHTKRYFVDVPAGTTSLVVDMSTDGPFVWGQVLDPEGRKLGDVRNAEATAPMAPVSTAIAVTRPGVYEIDVVSPANSQRHATLRLKAQAYSLTTSSIVAKPEGGFEVEIQNNFEPVRVASKVELRGTTSRAVVDVKASDKVTIPFTITDEDVKAYSEVKFTVTTAKAFYDLMTDYPFRVFDKNAKLVASGGLELVSEIKVEELSKQALGIFSLEIQGAFTKEPPAAWTFEIRQDRLFPVPQVISSLPRKLLETGGSYSVPLTFPQPCVTLVLSSSSGQLIQESSICR